MRLCTTYDDSYPFFTEQPLPSYSLDYSYDLRNRPGADPQYLYVLFGNGKKQIFFFFAGTLYNL